MARPALRRAASHGLRPRVKAAQARLADLGRPGARVRHHDIVGATGRDADDNDQGEVPQDRRLPYKVPIPTECREFGFSRAFRPATAKSG